MPALNIILSGGVVSTPLKGGAKRLEMGAKRLEMGAKRLEILGITSA
jgi:hypothetical protein